MKIRKYSKITMMFAATIWLSFYFFSNSRESTNEAIVHENDRLCDWENKVSLQLCLSEATRVLSRDELDSLIISLGFVQNQEGASNTVRYYSRSANDISGYKVTITLRLHSDGTTANIIVR